jgi:predicted peptidase
MILGALSMTHAEGDLKVEPGKQLPQKVAISDDQKTGSPSATIRFLLFVPKDYKADGDKWPLMLFLHGSGESSDDDLDLVKVHGPPKIVESKPDFPFVLVSPQAPKKHEVGGAWKPEELMPLIDHVASKLNVDADRIYVTGLSMGGYGTWRLAATHPERFAAAIPICGGGDAEKYAKGLSKVPIWAFHGGKDPVVPIKGTQDIVDAVKAEHGDIEFTVYPDAGHDSWTETYNNPKVYEWLLAHRRKSK